jgi:hypothetical protein
MNKFLMTAALIAATALTGVARAHAGELTSQDKALARSTMTPLQAGGCEVSLTQYKRLETGMTYSIATMILGCEGTEVVSTGSGKFKTEGFMWDGAGTVGANVQVMFQGGKLMMRAQFGLR